MINHARTLLLNLPGASNQRQHEGEEYIPGTYAPVQLPSFLLLARKILFGADPDRYFLNQRARELFKYLHETELSHFVYALDPRVTYWPEKDTPFLKKQFNATIQKLLGPENSQLFLQGKPSANNSRGTCKQDFVLSLRTDDGLVLDVTTGGKTTTEEIVASSGLSNAVTLANSGLSVKISNPTAGSRWTLTAIAKPAPAITTALPALELIGEPTIIELFGALKSDEPYATFKNLWNDHPDPVYKLCGFVLAMIYRTEEVRRSNG